MKAMFGFGLASAAGLSIEQLNAAFNWFTTTSCLDQRFKVTSFLSLEIMTV